MTNSDKLLKVLGGDPNAYATNYGVRKAILSALGGNPENCSNINEVDLEILRIYQNGGGGGTGGTIMLETANITKNGTYVPSSGYNGFDKVIVNVESGGGSDVVYVKDLNGMKFAYSNTSSISDKYVFSGVADFGYMFYRCKQLTTIPLIDTSNGTNFVYMFSNCNNLTTIPQLDTSGGTDFSYMFLSCSMLKSIPLIDTSKNTNFKEMFRGCSNLTTIPQLDTSNGTVFSDMFYTCSSLTTIPQLDVSNGTEFGSMFNSCSKLTTIPQLDTSNGTSFSYMFSGCKVLTTVSQLDVSSADSISYMFGSCSNLKNITFTGSINAGIDFSNCTYLTYDSVKSILTACSNTTKTTTRTMKFKRSLTDQNGELAALVADCNTKGWTISGLTIN